MNHMKIKLSLFILVLALSVIPVSQALAATSLQATSYNWAGYIASSGKYTAVSGSWTIPTVTAPANTSQSADVTWVGIGGLNTTDLIQVGTQAVTSPNGTVSYNAWMETLPQTSIPLSLAVKAGDSITASLSETTSNVWLITVRDNTTGQSYSSSVNYASSYSSAEWVEEMPSGANGNFIPLDNFGTVQFNSLSATQNGVAVTPSTANAQAMNIINGSNQALTTVSALGPDGQSFAVTRTSATPSSALTYSENPFPNMRFHRTSRSIHYVTFTGTSTPQTGSTSTQSFSFPFPFPGNFQIRFVRFNGISTNSPSTNFRVISFHF